MRNESGEQSLPFTKPPVSAAQLVSVVQAVPGVRGIEPGIATTLKAIEARLRRSDTVAASHGLIVGTAAASITVEVSLDRRTPVKDVVESLQRSVRAVLGEAAQEWAIHVRVQSLAP